MLPKKVAVHLALLQQFVGISAVATYAREIAEGSLSSFKPVLPSILNLEQVISTLLSSFLLTKYGRKTILQVGTLGAAVANVVITLGYYLNDSYPSLSVVLILTALFYYMANFGLSLGPIVWMYIPEVVKPSFLPFSTMVNWGGSALIILLFPIIKAHLPEQNPGPLFLFFAIWSGISYVLNKKYVIETRGKTSKQID
jgi:SP family arabinose:H+ symporter-like MFS transporter